MAEHVSEYRGKIRETLCRLNNDLRVKQSNKTNDDEFFKSARKIKSMLEGN